LGLVLGLVNLPCDVSLLIVLKSKKGVKGGLSLKEKKNKRKKNEKKKKKKEKKKEKGGFRGSPPDYLHLTLNLITLI